MKWKVTAQSLARLLDEELERDSWGDVEPFLLKMVANGIDADDDNAEDARALEEVLERIVARLLQGGTR
jgi:uncharacterized protein YgfB (UPF0149 family)